MVFPLYSPIHSPKYEKASGLFDYYYYCYYYHYQILIVIIIVVIVTLW